MHGRTDDLCEGMKRYGTEGAENQGNTRAFPPRMRRRQIYGVSYPTPESGLRLRLMELTYLTIYIGRFMTN